VQWEAERWEEAARMARRVLDQVAQSGRRLPESELQALIALADGRTDDFIEIMESSSRHPRPTEVTTSRGRHDIQKSKNG
jgi:hypothetical protein